MKYIVKREVNTQATEYHYVEASSCLDAIDQFDKRDSQLLGVTVAHEHSDVWDEHCQPLDTWETPSDMLTLDSHPDFPDGVLLCDVLVVWMSRAEGFHQTLLEAVPARLKRHEYAVMAEEQVVKRVSQRKGDTNNKNYVLLRVAAVIRLPLNTKFDGHL